MAKNDLLSYGTIFKTSDISNRHIVALSGGASSAYVAWWAKENIFDPIFYFNDTHWEHPDLYRFLDDIKRTLNIDIIVDSDSKSPEDIFYDQKMLGSNMAPICSRVLKAERLQSFCMRGDTIYFGIDTSELHRAARISPIYARLGVDTKFPLIDGVISRNDVFKKIDELGIDIPQMYKDGFSHNNCSGGCVRAGRKQWASLFRVYPDVYAERERVEIEFSEWTAKRKDVPYKRYSFLKDTNLTELREMLSQQLDLFDNEPDDFQGECVGICGRMY